MIIKNRMLKNFNYVAKDFINKLLVVDPDSRLNAHQALAHPWFTANPSFNTSKEAIKTDEDIKFLLN
jgi:serine/threonine protein kinase